jgi:ligand-binding SRPBCC domain-containing protein
MRIHRLERMIELRKPLADVFPFFADPGNLERLTPPWLHFRIETPLPISMAEGVPIDYRLRVRGIPLRWRSRITAYEPPHRFVDEQIKGPYRLWVHEHLFEERDGVTLVRDRVRYAVPGGEWIHRLLVRPDVERIFRFRHDRLRALFDTEGSAP